MASINDVVLEFPASETAIVSGPDVPVPVRVQGTIGFSDDEIARRAEFLLWIDIMPFDPPDSIRFLSPPDQPLYRFYFDSGVSIGGLSLGLTDPHLVVVAEADRYAFETTNSILIETLDEDPGTENRHITRTDVRGREVSFNQLWTLGDEVFARASLCSLPVTTLESATVVVPQSERPDGLRVPS